MKVILVHGFNKTSKDMMVLEKHLSSYGYECYRKDLPITFNEIDKGTDRLNEYVEKIINVHLNEGEKINLIGHSTGGLIIRKLISESEYTNYINRCVQIATPNRGCKLATLACKIKPWTTVFSTLQSLRFETVKNMKLNEAPHVEVGAIAGNENNLLLGNLIREENDGRVEVNSVYYEGLNDFIVLPYGHKDIHYQTETAELVHQFLQEGQFSGEENDESGFNTTFY